MELVMLTDRETNIIHLVFEISVTTAYTYCDLGYKRPFKTNTFSLDLPVDGMCAKCLQGAKHDLRYVIDTPHFDHIAILMRSDLGCANADKGAPWRLRYTERPNKLWIKLRNYQQLMANR